MNNSEKKTIKRKFEGVVVSDKANKTVVVLVSTTKVHPKYSKRYTSSKRYQAHDEKNEYKVGDEVVIIETRPISKTKKWRVLGKKEKKG